VLTGPGIAGARNLNVYGLDQGFATEWAQVHAAFPRGVDVFLAQGDALLGLPRSTAMAQQQSQQSPLPQGT
jgi:alpha-D-ribose 1-methylphosphonate 5-triphosphate synthase subunit PhnH